MGKKDTSHLKKWQPGVSGNPAGRAIDHASRVGRAILSEKIPPHILKKINRSLARRDGPRLEEGSTFLDCIMATQIVKAALGDTDSFKAVLNRCYGVSKKNDNLTVTSNMETQFSYTYAPEVILQKLKTFIEGGNVEQAEADAICRLAERQRSEALAEEVAALPAPEPQPDVIDIPIESESK